MKFEKLQTKSSKEFTRSTGIARTTFDKMVEVLKGAFPPTMKKGSRDGRPPKLLIEDQILLTLEYLREYRTYFHLGVDYGVGESTTCRIIRRTEDTLIQSKAFSLPSRKEGMDPKIKKQTLDCTESPIQRPKKSKDNTTQGRKRDILLRHK
jgi:Helix-turn-helix of DDE superfamily endonuclease